MPELPAIDTSRANMARCYDYLLGGKDNFQVDRDAVDRALIAVPEMKTTAIENRHFLGRVVEYMSRSGIDQFLDLGSGIPSDGNVHEVARRFNPNVRVVYVDYDRVAFTHMLTRLVGSPNTTAFCLDLRDAEEVLENARGHLDFARPIGLLMIAVLHAVPEAPPAVQTFREALPQGSYVAISHSVSDASPEKIHQMTSTMKMSIDVAARTRPEVEDFFAGLELVSPGLVPIQEWRPDEPTSVPPENAWVVGGVAVKQ